MTILSEVLTVTSIGQLRRDVTKIQCNKKKLKKKKSKAKETVQKKSKLKNLYIHISA